MSIRARVALTALLTTVGLVAILSALLVFSFRRAEIESIDTRLEAQWELVERPAVIAAASDRRFLDSALLNRLDRAVIGRVSVDGSVRLEVGTDAAVLSAAELVPGVATVTVDSVRWRVFTRESGVPVVLTRGESYLVQVALPLADVDASVVRLRRSALVFGAVGALAAAGFGWFGAALALRPLTGFRSRLGAVRSLEDLSIRIDDVSGASEVATLATAFDDVLDHLETSDRQRSKALESARSFGAVASHELRTPLMSIGANLETMAAHPDLPADMRAEMVGAMVAEHGRLVDLLEALRMLGRGELAGAEVFEEIDVAVLLDAAASRFGRHCPDAVVELDVVDVGEIRGWREGLEVMVDNLLSNAGRHGRSADGSLSVWVSVRGRAEDVVLTVADAGEGIPVAEQEEIFERFRSGSRATGGGLGLGLALVRQQAELHGGSVEVAGGESRGAIFIVAISRNPHRLPTENP